jgi:hypothetical protein
MNNKKREIVGIRMTKTHLNVDLRVSIPLEEMTKEFSNDLIRNREKIISGYYLNDLIEGRIFVKYLCEVLDTEEGERLKFSVFNSKELDFLRD